MKPYYATEDGAIQIYHARWEDVLTAGVFEPKEVALVHADPPYGVKERTDRASKGRGYATAANDFPAVAGDATPFDPAPLLSMACPLILWGANHYSDRVPGSPSWIVWDKRCDVLPDDNADGETAWSNLGGPLRIFRHVWKGMIKASERDAVRIHPTQKPEALSAWIFAHAIARKKLKRGDLVLVPYMGSGPDLRPALAAGLRVLACEVSEDYCRTAVNARLGVVAREEPVNNLGPLFASR